MARSALFDRIFHVSVGVFFLALGIWIVIDSVKAGDFDHLRQSWRVILFGIATLLGLRALIREREQEASGDPTETKDL